MAWLWQNNIVKEGNKYNKDSNNANNNNYEEDNSDNDNSGVLRGVVKKRSFYGQADRKGEGGPPPRPWP